MTAVEWLEEFMNNGSQKSEGIISLAFAKAKEMEKQQIEDAWEDVGTDGVTTAEEYYENTFKNTKE